MKNAKWMLPVTLLLLSGLMLAQSLTKTVVSQVPFDFMVGNKIVPAGECVVTADQNILSIHNFEARKSALVASSRANESQDNRTVLVFERYGNQYFLSEMKIEGSTMTYKLPESRAEAELRAQNAPASPVILLAALK
jgi:hypothetical protein